MADVTINELTKGTPTGGNTIPYSTGSNTLGVPVSALFQNAGNIGIGTNNPQFTLDLTNTSDTGERAIRILNGSLRDLLIGVEGSSANRFLGSSINNAFVGSSSSAGLELATNNSVRMYINSDGNVGIGTTTPQAKLDVVGDVKATNTPKAWASFNGKAAVGTNQPIRASYNITSILRADDNLYQVTFPAGVFSNTDYAFFGTSSSSLNRASILSGPLVSAPTATIFKFGTFSLVYTGQPAGWIGESAEYINIAFFAL